MTNNGNDVFEMTDEDLVNLKEQNIQLPMSSLQLQRYLPHRYPFALLDRVVAIRPNHSIVGFKNVSTNEDFFNGHFPEQPLMPGVLMVEALAQIAGVLGFVSEKEDLSDGKIYLFAGVDKVRFKHQVIPGDQLVLKAAVLKIKSNIHKYQCSAYVEDKLACSAEVMLIKQNRESLR